MTTRIGTVTAPRLNLRRDPSTERPPIVALPRGAEVEIVGEEGGWFRVRFADQEGFVSGGFLAVREVGGAAPAPGAAGPLSARPALREVALEPEAQIPLAPDLTPQARIAAGTWNRFGGLLAALSREIGIPPAAAVSVLCVESGGAGFLGVRMIIRFENHVFFGRWGDEHPETFARHFAYDPAERWKGHRFRAGEAEPWTDFHGDQDAEWRVFEFARGLDETAAMCSISMGAPQIMGFNHRRVGYGTVQEMFAAFSGDVRFHVLGLFDFVRGDPALVQALREGDYERFARGYNGSGQAERYGALIRNHFAACAPLLSTSASRFV